MNVYESHGVPADYVCGECGAKGCKLWRQYQSTNLDLRCCVCAEAQQNKPYNVDNYDIGWYVPAVPTAEGHGYWGYTSVPDEGVEWWKKLPMTPLVRQFACACGHVDEASGWTWPMNKRGGYAHHPDGCDPD